MNNLAEEDKIFAVYKDKYGLGTFDMSDKKEELTKFLFKETVIQVAMMYLPLKFSAGFTRFLAKNDLITKTSEYKNIEAILTKNLPEKLPEIPEKYTKMIQNTEIALHRWMLRWIDYTIHWLSFSTIYYIPASLRQWKDLEESVYLYLKHMTNPEELIQNIVMLGWMKYLWEIWTIKTAETKLIKSYELKYKPNPNLEKPHLDSKIAWWLYWVTLETGAIYSIWSGLNIAFEWEWLTKEDFVFAFSMVIWLRLTLKAEQQLIKVVKEDGEIKIKLLTLENKLSKWKELVKSLIPEEKLIKILKDKQINEKIIQDLDIKNQDLTEKSIKTIIKGIKTILYENIHKELKLKWKKLSQLDKDKIKFMVDVKTKQIIDELAKKYGLKFKSEDTINNIFKKEEKQIRLWQIVDMSWWEKIVEDILKWLKWKKLDKETDIYVMWKIEELIQREYTKAYGLEIWKYEDLMDYYKYKLWERYQQLKEATNKIWSKEKSIEEKIDDLIRRLEKIDKLEYKEIIEKLEDYKVKVLRENINRKPSL